MELRDLQSFLILSSNLNFAQTADICAASPSTITRRIQRLEKELKCELFIRDTQNVQLTTAGIRLKAFASEFIENWNSLKFEFQYLNNTLQGQLKVFCSVTASYLILPNIISLFQKTYPNVELKLETGEISDSLGRGRHTTRAVSFYNVNGGKIADTPGFSTFEITEIESKDLAKYFREFNKYINKCEFLDCTHIKEENCGLKKAIEEGKIHKDRYERFCKIYNELKEKEERKKW